MGRFLNKAGTVHALHSSTSSRVPRVVIMNDKLQFRILMLESYLVYVRQSKDRPAVQLPSPWHSQLDVTVTVVPGNV